MAVDSTLLQIKKVSLDDGDGFINDLYRCVTVDFENAKLYALCYASNTVTIKRYRIPVFDIGLNEKLDDSTLTLEDTTVLQCSTFHFYGSYTPYQAKEKETEDGGRMHGILHISTVNGYIWILHFP